MENKISSTISWRRCCLRCRLHEHQYEVCFGPLRVGDGSSVLPGGLLLPGQGLCRRLWIRSSSSPVGVLADGLSVSQIHLDRRSGAGAAPGVCPCMPRHTQNLEKNINMYS